MVPGPGIEPGWIAPTVFETVASTDSAIRADGGGIARGKVTKFFLFLARGGNYFIWGIHGGGFTGDSGDFRRCSPEAGSRTFDGALRGGRGWEERADAPGCIPTFGWGMFFCGGGLFFAGGDVVVVDFDAEDDGGGDGGDGVGDDEGDVDGFAIEALDYEED